MNRAGRIVGGLLCALCGALPPYFIYAGLEGENEQSLPLLAIMLVAAIASFAVFAICRQLFSTGPRQRLFGVILSYAALIVLYLVGGAIAGNLDEMIMWLPVALMFAIPFMAPLVFMAWLGSVLAFGRGNTIAD